jgi:glycosyltransferase involved in cell wall biosynthesis
MRIALDVRACFGVATGIGQYTVELTRALLAMGVDVTLWFAARSPAARERLAPEVLALQGPARLECTSLPNRLLYDEPALSLWRHWPRWAPTPRLVPPDADLYHAVYWPLPLTHRPPMVLTVHDLVALQHPEWFAPQERRTHAAIRDLAPRAAHVITDSETTRQALLSLTRVASANVTTIPLGVGAPFTEPIAPEDIERVRQAHGLQRPFILSLGTLEPRKNQGRLIDAYDLLCQEHGPQWDLVLVGGQGRGEDEVSGRLQRTRKGCVRHLGYVAREDIAPLYAAAQVLAFVSLAEGFGLPALEAMAVGCPTVASNVSSVPEVVGDASRLVDPLSVEDIAQGLAEVLADDALAARLRRLGRARAATMTWEATAHATAEVYRAVLNR